MPEVTGRRPTLKDIAIITGYSINTVSRALRNKTDIAECTRDRIKLVSMEMGYINNTIASSLRLGYTNTIAVIIPDVSNLFFTFMMEDIERKARKNGYSSFLLNTSENEEQELLAIKTAINKNVDGIIFSPAQQTGENVQYLIDSGVPFVLLGRYFNDIEADYVVGNDFMGGYQATSHLIENGHRNIVMINAQLHNSSAYLRYQGYLKAHADAGLPVQEELVYETFIKGDDYKHKLYQLLMQRKDITAVFAFNDMVAWSVFDYLLKKGYHVPEDISIVGFDYIQSRVSIPFQLTTVDIHFSKLSTAAVSILMDKIKRRGEMSDSRQETFDTTLIKGATVKRI